MLATVMATTGRPHGGGWTAPRLTFTRALLYAPRDASPTTEAKSLARQIGRSAADVCKNLPSPINALDPRVALERASISRQYGLVHMGFLATMKRFGILREEQPPEEQPRVRRARRCKLGPTQHKRASGSEQFLYDGKTYAVQKNLRELQEFVKGVQGFDASMGTLSAVSSVSVFHVYCLAMASRMTRWFGGSDSLQQYVVPHCVRKLWMQVERLCDKGAWRTTAAGRSFTPAGLKSEDFANVFANLSLKELLELCSDLAAYMQCLPDACPFRVLQLGFPGEHPLMVSAWACLLHDATSTLGTTHCLDIAQKRHCSLIAALDELLLTRGAELPPNFFELFRTIT